MNSTNHQICYYYCIILILLLWISKITIHYKCTFGLKEDKEYKAVDSAASERPVTAELRITTEDMLRLATRATDEDDIPLPVSGRYARKYQKAYLYQGYGRSCAVQLRSVPGKCQQHLSPAKIEKVWVYQNNSMLNNVIMIEV